MRCAHNSALLTVPALPQAGAGGLPVKLFTHILHTEPAFWRMLEACNCGILLEARNWCKTSDAQPGRLRFFALAETFHVRHSSRTLGSGACGYRPMGSPHEGGTVG